MHWLTALLLAGLSATVVAAQSPAPLAEELRRGDSLEAARQPEAALDHFRSALALDSTNYAALWKASRSVVNIAKQIEGNADAVKQRRDSLYGVARGLAEASVRLYPDSSAGHTMLAQVLGRLSRTRGGKERVRFARTIYDEAMRAIALDSMDDIAYHIIGAWHAEVRRLSGFQRFFAKTLFGAGFLDKANWNDAQLYLQRAVALKPQHIYHHLELAEVYVDVGKYAAARELLTAIHDFPVVDVMDPEYKNQAALLLSDIRDEKDRT